MNGKPGLIQDDRAKHLDIFVVSDLKTGQLVEDDNGNPILFRAADLLIRSPPPLTVDCSTGQIAAKNIESVGKYSVLS